MAPRDRDVCAAAHAAPSPPSSVFTETRTRRGSGCEAWRGCCLLSTSAFTWNLTGRPRRAPPQAAAGRRPATGRPPATLLPKEAEGSPPERMQSGCLGTWVTATAIVQSRAPGRPHTGRGPWEPGGPRRNRSAQASPVLPGRRGPGVAGTPTPRVVLGASVATCPEPSAVRDTWGGGRGTVTLVEIRPKSLNPTEKQTLQMRS